MGGAGLSGHPIAILAGSGIAAAIPQVAESLNNSGAHGLSELLYAYYSSAGANNGSAFAGFNANTVFLNLSLGLVMLFARFLPIAGTPWPLPAACPEKENRRHCRHAVHHQRHVCISAHSHCPSGGRTQLFPGALPGTHRRICQRHLLVTGPPSCPRDSAAALRRFSHGIQSKSAFTGEKILAER